MSIIVDSAEWLDDHAIKRLLQLRRHEGLRFSVVMCQRLAKNETMPEAFDQLWQKIDVEYRQDIRRAHAVQLQRLDKLEFATKVLQQGIFQLLQIEIPPATTQEELEEQRYIGQRCWNATQGDWVSIERLYEEFEAALGAMSTGPRRLSAEVLRQVFPDW